MTAQSAPEGLSQADQVTTIVHLVLHGEVANPDGILYGRIPGFNLSEDGKMMAKAAASFMVGRTTNFQVMQRQSELIEARLRRGVAVADYHKAVAQLQFLSGDILPQYRVNVRSKK